MWSICYCSNCYSKKCSLLCDSKVFYRGVKIIREFNNKLILIIYDIYFLQIMEVNVSFLTCHNFITQMNIVVFTYLFILICSFTNAMLFISLIDKCFGFYNADSSKFILQKRFQKWVYFIPDTVGLYLKGISVRGRSS